MADTPRVSGYQPSNPLWDVPDAELVELTDKRHEFALIIPVINEGERIRRQLQAIKQLSPAVDIAITDGGSDDDSLDSEFLRECGVRALLIKRGSGWLSAQLRMGYAWALEQDYRGIVTIDGNGKDGVEAIPKFIDALQEGFDYVQGSRYIRNGRAVNTPVLRWLAVRLLHSPMISLAAGHRLTDTTNGFRGYSRRLLLDERVRPFRDIFTGYNLLFYLSVRAGRLGFKICEIPVERRYPGPGEKTPTKITGPAAYGRLLIETWKAAVGRYNP